VIVTGDAELPQTLVARRLILLGSADWIATASPALRLAQLCGSIPIGSIHQAAQAGAVRESRQHVNQMESVGDSRFMTVRLGLANKRGGII